MNLYQNQKERQQERINAFLHEYAFFAFSQEQFEEGLQKLGIDPGAEKVVVPISGGGYVLKEKAPDFLQIMNDFDAERLAALADPETGGQFARDMFLYELANHEYTYTGSAEERSIIWDIHCQTLNRIRSCSRRYRKQRTSF